MERVSRITRLLYKEYDSDSFNPETRHESEIPILLSVFNCRMIAVERRQWWVCIEAWLVISEKVSLPIAVVVIVDELEQPSSKVRLAYHVVRRLHAPVSLAKFEFTAGEETSAIDYSRVGSTHQKERPVEVCRLYLACFRGTECSVLPGEIVSYDIG